MHGVSAVHPVAGSLLPRDRPGKEGQRIFWDEVDSHAWWRFDEQVSLDRRPDGFRVSEEGWSVRWILGLREAGPRLMPDAQHAGRMVVVGLTGGICSGKSTVAALFKNLGAIVIDADQVAHEVVEPDRPLFEVVASTFGREVIGADGRIDRGRLGAIVFADPKARRRLEELLHPAIIQECERRIRLAEVSGVAVCLVDAALLIESGWYTRFNAVILVEASETVQLDRLVGSRGLSRDDAMLRIRSQMSQEEKRRHAHYVIENEGPLDETERQVNVVWEQLCATASS